MGKIEVLTKITESIVSFDAETAKQTILIAVKEGVPSSDIFKSVSSGLDIVGEKYEKGEYYLSELIMAGETAKAAVETLKAYLNVEKTETLGKVVVGTVKGDLHDIGKNIFVMVLTYGGFDVYDLGVDVPAEKFVEKIEEVDADIVGLSALLSTTVTYMKTIIEKLKESDIRNRVKVIIGGPPTSKRLAEEIGADAYAPDAVLGLEICREFAKKIHP